MDTRTLHDLVLGDGPFASVYFDAGGLVDLRWRAVRDQLEAQDASPALLDALGAAMSSSSGTGGRALIARGDRVVFDRYLPVPPAGYTARVSALPYLLPLVDLAEPLVPHVVVRLDHLGADLRGVDHSGRPVAVATVGGRLTSDRLRAAELADISVEACRLVEWLTAPLLVLAGPLRARRSLRNALPSWCQHLVAEVDAFPRPDGDLELDRTVQRLASRGNHCEQRAAVDRFRDESARLSGVAVHGLRAVSGALAAGAVDTLLLSDALVGSRTLWVDPELSDISVVPGECMVEQRADEVLPRAAVATSADIVLVGDQVRLHENVGALLRG
jgi:hypothetical protein